MLAHDPCVEPSHATDRSNDRKQEDESGIFRHVSVSLRDDATCPRREGDDPRSDDEPGEICCLPFDFRGEDDVFSDHEEQYV